MFPQIRKILLGLVLFIGWSTLQAQVYIPTYGAIVNQCSESGILANLTEFQNLGVKSRGTTAQDNTLQWLKNKYLSYGYTAAQITEDPFTYGGTTCKNVIVTKTGTVYPNTFLIIDGHYDTVNGPGANDNGSGVAVILEIARLLRNVPTEYSIKFINFSGEEDGLIGSQHYVSNVVNATTPKMDIKLVINIDEVGGVAGLVNNTITCERDMSPPFSNNAASNTMTTQLINCVRLYSPLQTHLANAYASDYMPFQSNGEIITGLFEKNETPHAHTANDVLANMDPNYVYNVAKAAIGAALHFAVVCANCTLAIDETTNFKVGIYPNPASSFINIDKGELTDLSYTYCIEDILGKEVLRKTVHLPKQHEPIAVDSLHAGMYFLTLEAGNKRIVKKIIIN